MIHPMLEIIGAAACIGVGAYIVYCLVVIVVIRPDN